MGRFEAGEYQNSPGTTSATQNLNKCEAQFCVYLAYTFS